MIYRSSDCPNFHADPKIDRARDEWRSGRLKIAEMEWSYYDDFMKKYSRRVNPESYIALISVANAFESMGPLVKEKVIPVRLVQNMYGAGAIRFWEKFGPIYIQMRVNYNNPEDWLHIEYLYHELKNNKPLIRGSFPNRRIVLTAPASR